MLYWLLVLILLPLEEAYSYTMSYSQIQDLDTTSAATFTTAASSWTYSSVISSPAYTTLCGVYLLGGPGILGTSLTSYNHYFQQTYSSLPLHNMIYYSLSFYAFDGWSSKTFDSFYLQFDDRVINGWILDVSTHTDNLCGTSALDIGPINIYGRVYHNKTSLTFRVVSLLDQDSNTESFGFKDVNFLLAKPSSTVTEEMCGRKTSFTFATNNCPCSTGQYEANYVGSGACANCHPNCQECFGPSERECYKCKPNYFFNGYACVSACYTTCSSSIYNCFGAASTNCLVCNSGYFLSSNNFCVSSADCSFPLVKSGTLCLSPCGTNQFAYWNGSCLSTCPSPLKTSSIANYNLCSNPCNSLYLYYNSTCSSICPSPWSPRTEGGGVKYCDFLCDLTQVLYWDKTCQDSCLFPLQQVYEKAYRFCIYPCTGNDFLYPNGTCQSTCTSPLVSSIFKGKNLCTSPCNSSAQFLYWNGSCDSSCPSPYLIYTESITNFCLPPCKSPTPYYNPTTGTCTSSCSGVTTSDSSGLQLICTSPGKEPGFFKKTFLIASTPTGERSFLAPAKSMTYLRILDIQAPQRLAILMQNRAKPILSLRFGYEMSDGMKSDFTQYSVPSVFEKVGYHSDFLVNYWMEASSYLILFGITALLVFLEKFFEKLGLPAFQTIFQRFKIMMMWNYFLIMLATGVDELVLATILEFKASYFNSFLSIFNLIVCVLVNGILVAFVADVIYLVPRAKKMRDEASVSLTYNTYAEFLQKWQSYQVCFRGFNDDSSHKRYFFLLYTIRLAIPMIIACLIYDVPLMQTMLYLSVNICSLIYIIKMRPLKSRVNHVQLVIMESITLIINFSLVMLAILDLAGTSTGKGGVFFGDVVIFGNFCLNFTAVVFLAFKLTRMIRQADKLEDRKIELKKATLVQALFLPIQQGGFGFEQFQLANFIQENENEAETEEGSSQRRKDSGMSEENDPFRIQPQPQAENNYIVNHPKFDDGQEYYDEIENEIEIFAQRAS